MPQYPKGLAIIAKIDFDNADVKTKELIVTYSNFGWTAIRKIRSINPILHWYGSNTNVYWNYFAR